MNTYCYACQTYNSGISWNVQDAEPICGRCHSAFVELVSQAGLTQPSSSSSPQQQQQQQQSRQRRQSAVGRQEQQQQQQQFFDASGMQQSLESGVSQMQSHTFTTPGGQEVQVHMATTVLPVGMGHSEVDGGVGGSAGVMPQAILTSLLQGMQPQADGDGGSPGHPFNFGMQFGGSFGSGSFAGDNNLEALLSRLAEQHQPMFVPTAPDTRTSLPRLKVATPAQAAAAARTAPSVCSAKQPASEGDRGDAQQGAQQQQQQQQVGQQSGQQPGQHAACKAGDACTVCHEECEADTIVVQLPCNHCFHEDCIMPWLEQHNTCPVCRFQLPADPNHRVQPQAAPAPPDGAAGGAGLASAAMSGSDMWADVGNLFGGGAAQILSNITAALDGIAAERGPFSEEAAQQRRQRREALTARVNAAVERTHAAQRERETAGGSRGRRRRAAVPSAPSGAGDGSTYRPGSAADGTGSGNRRVRRRTELRSSSGNAADAVDQPASPPPQEAAAADASTAAGRQGRTIGILVGHPFMVGRHPGHSSARRARTRATTAAAGQQQADQHANAADQAPGALSPPTSTDDNQLPQHDTPAGAASSAARQPPAARSQHAMVTSEIQPAPEVHPAPQPAPQGRGGDAVSQGFSLPLLAPVGRLASGAAHLLGSIFRR